MWAQHAAAGKSLWIAIQLSSNLLPSKAASLRGRPVFPCLQGKTSSPSARLCSCQGTISSPKKGPQKQPRMMMSALLLVRSTATTSATGARRRGTLFNGTRWSAYSSGQRCGAARPCITYRTASRSTSPPRPTPPRRTRRPAEQRPPRQTANEFHWRRSCQQVPSTLKCSTGYSEEARDDSKNKGTGEAVSDPEEDKQAANPPHHDK